MKISIALCTFNGDRYLAEQLASIASQDLLPAEVVVCDDRSADRSVEIVGQFARRVSFPVRLEVNPVNLGVVANFEKAIGLCSGELIFLADQDDLWVPHKLARIAAEFESNPDLGLAFSDAEAVDGRGCGLGYRLWQAIGLTRREGRLAASGRLFSVLLRRNVVTGATMAFRANLRPLVLPIPRFWEHDAWIAMLTSATAPCAAIPEPLIRYRQHATQVQGERVLSLYQQYRIAKQEGTEKFSLVARRYTAAKRRLEESGCVDPGNPIAESLGQKAEHFQAKFRMRRSRWSRWPLIARELARGRYHRYSRGWKSLAQDLVL